MSGPQDTLPFDPRALVLYGRCGVDPKAGFAVGALDGIEIEPCHDVDGAGAVAGRGTPVSSKRRAASAD